MRTSLLALAAAAAAQRLPDTIYADFADELKGVTSCTERDFGSLLLGHLLHYPSDPSCSHDGPHSQHAECFSLDVRSNPPPSQRRAPSLPHTHTQPSIAAALLSRLPPPRAHPAAAAERAALPPSC